MKEVLKREFVCLLTPNNWTHKAGDGTKTRQHSVRFIHPALAANTGWTQLTLILEKWITKNEKDNSVR